MVNIECVPISAYCYATGETVDAINKRIQRGVWLDGVHVLKVEGVKERWIDLNEVAKWARKNSIVNCPEELQ
ncbi:excisionase [Photorhabdus tasmaniensis]